MNVVSFFLCLCVPLSFLCADARGSADGGGDGGEYGDDEVQDFLPKFFLVHGRFFSYEL